MKKIELKLGSNGYSIIIGSGLLEQAGQCLRDSGYSNRVVVITDNSVRRRYGRILRNSFLSRGLQVSVLSVPSGEEQKSLETAGSLFNRLSEIKAERTTPIVALGGGVIGDLAGFIAATYLRGVPFIQVPTTLLAQVDSSIGGKVAVNHEQLKNNIGAFYQPKLVLSDTSTLKTLSARQIRDGLAEIIKYGVIMDKELFSYLEENIERIKSMDAESLEYVISRSAGIKADVVEKDERDSGLRNILNYGHTIGHAVETVSNFKVSHGEAVAVGMLAAARISRKMGILAETELIRLENLVKKAGLPLKIPSLNPGKMIEAMKHDKKILHGNVRFVLARSIGEVYVSEDVSASLIKKVLVELNG